MTVSAVIAEFGAYYLSHGQNLNSIYKQMTRGFATQQAFTHVITDDTVWRASEARHTRIVQPFQKAFTPTGTAEFLPVEIRQYNQKADLADYPDDIKSSWLGFLASNDVKRTEWPYVKFWMDQLILPRIKQDIELNEAGRGVFVAPTPGVAGAAGTSMDGILTIINKHITASKIVPIALGALPTDDVALVDYFEDYFDAIPIQYSGIPMNTYVPERLVIRYKRGYEKKYGLLTNSDVTAAGVIKIRHSNITLVGLASLNLKADGTPNDRFFTTPKENAIMLSRGFKNADGIFDIQPNGREVKLLTDWWLGFGFIIPQIVWVNDGAPVTP